MNFPAHISQEEKSLVSRGIDSLKAKKFNTAEAIFDTVISRNKNSAIAFYYRGHSRRWQNKFITSRNDFQTTLALNPAISCIYFELGKANFLIYNYKKAYSLLKISWKLSPGVTDALFLRALAAWQTGDFYKAWNLTQRLLLKDPYNFKGNLLAGIISGKPRKSTVADFTKAIEISPKNEYGYLWRGYALISMDKLEQALDDWDMMVSISGKPDQLLLRAKLKIMLEDFNGAFLDIETALEATPVNEDEFTGGNDIFDSRTGFQSGCRYLIKNQHSINQQALIGLKKGYGEMVAGEYKHALNAIIDAESTETSTTSKYLKALVYDRLSLYDSAFKYYNLVLREDNNIFEAHKKRGYYLAVVGDAKGAYQDLAELKRLVPTSYAISLLSAEIKQSLNDQYGAILDYTKYLRIDSGNSNARKKRAACRAAVNDLMGAIEDLNYIEKNDSSTDVYYDIVRYHETMKNSVGARDAFLRGHKYKKWNYPAQMDFAQLFFSSNNWEGLGFACADARATYHYASLNNFRYFWRDLDIRLDYYELRLAYHREDYEACISKASRLIGENDQQQKLELLYYRGAAYLAIGQKKKAKYDLEEPAKAGFADAKERFDSIKAW